MELSKKAVLKISGGVIRRFSFFRYTFASCDFLLKK
jgi:hypothetical protein